MRLNMVTKLTILCTLFLLASCQLGQTIMVSKGEAGGARELITGEAEYCKLTATEDFVITDADKEAFRAYCPLPMQP